MKKILILACVFLLSFSTIFANSASAASVFKDLPETDPIYKDLKFLYDRDLMTFPADEVPRFVLKDSEATRSAIIIILGKTLGLKKYETKTPFSDVDNKGYYPGENGGYILELNKLGIIKGFSDGTFRPYKNLTRGQFALIIDRAFGEYLPSGDREFTDVPKSHEAYKAVKKLVGTGITTGYSDGTFKPGETLTQGHVYVFMSRLVKYLESQNIKVPLNGGSTENNQTNQSNLPTQIVPIDDSKIKTGMSREEVYELIKSQLYMGDKDGDGMLYTKSGRNGLPGKTHYLFNNGKLRSISTSFDWKSLDVNFRTADQLHEFYIRKLAQEFGTDYKTYNTSQTLIMTAWEKPSNTIILYTSINEKVQVDLLIGDKIEQ